MPSILLPCSRPFFFKLIIGWTILCCLLACNNTNTPVTNNEIQNISATNQQPSTSPSKTSSTLQKELDLLEAQLGNSNRTIWQQPRVIIQKLGDLSDKVVADIGAGPFGYFSFQLVNLAKKVIAIDIDEKALGFMDSLRVDVLPPHKQKALETRLAAPDNPNLKPGEADVIILVNIYAYLPNPILYLKTLKEGLSPNGKILIVDFKMRRLPIGPSQQNKVPLFMVERNLEEAGFNISLVDDRTLDYQYIVIATK